MVIFTWKLWQQFKASVDFYLGLIYSTCKVRWPNSCVALHSCSPLRGSRQHVTSSHTTHNYRLLKWLRRRQEDKIARRDQEGIGYLLFYSLVLRCQHMRWMCVFSDFDLKNQLLIILETISIACTICLLIFQLSPIKWVVSVGLKFHCTNLMHLCSVRKSLRSEDWE